MTDLEKAFRILNVAPGSSEAVIKKAWRALVRSYHPDMAKADPVAANKRLADINAAFDAVCSSTPEDIRRLQQAAERRASARQRAEAAARRRSARAKDDTRKARDAAPVHVPAVRTGHARASRLPVNIAVVRDTSAGRDSAILIALAERAFSAAQAICAPQLTPARPSTYL